MYIREIGSDFHISPDILNKDTTINNIFFYLESFDKQLFDSGRSALLALLMDLNSQKVLLPNYICESVRKTFMNSDVAYNNIDIEFKIDCEDILKKCNDNKFDILYLYFFNGYIDENYDFDELKKIKREKNFIIIEDTTHSIFSNKRIIGDYCICSLRKWFPIADGGILYSKNNLNKKIFDLNSWAQTKEKAMIDKAAYLKGKQIDKKSFFYILRESENCLDEQDVPFNISNGSYDILQKIDINEIILRRKNNLNILRNLLKNSNIKVFAADGINQVPIFCPIKSKMRDDLKDYLIANHIYCPTHWPLYDELKKYKIAVNNSTEELTIPIDQRYSEEDMRYIADKVIKFYV